MILTLPHCVLYMYSCLLNGRLPRRLPFNVSREGETNQIKFKIEIFKFRADNNLPIKEEWFTARETLRVSLPYIIYSEKINN